MSTLWHTTTILEQRIEVQKLYIEAMRMDIQRYIIAKLVSERELSYAHAALRRKHTQLKYLKATIELHKEYIKSHTSEPT